MFALTTPLFALLTLLHGQAALALPAPQNVSGIHPRGYASTVNLFAPAGTTDDAPIYDLESIPAGRFGGRDGGQWTFNFDGEGYTSDRFDVFVLKKNEAGVHVPVVLYECALTSNPESDGEIGFTLTDSAPFYNVLFAPVEDGVRPWVAKIECGEKECANCEVLA